MGEHMREVLGIDGQVLVVHPSDRILVHVSPDLTAEDARRVYCQIEEVLGKGRALVFAGDVQIVIERGAQAVDRG